MTTKFLGLLLAVAVVVTGTASAAAATTVVTPANTQGWSEADTRPGGDVNFVEDATAPGGEGALQLTTDATTAAKAQYLHETNTAIGDLTELSYSTKQIAGPVHAAASYQLAGDMNGAATGGFTTLVYEPYQNGVVTPGVWQSWDVDAGHFWSSRNVTCSNGSLVAGGGGAPFYTLSQLQTMCPEAVVSVFGVNVGTFNPNYNVLVDLANFNGDVYDFEVVNTPVSKDQCKGNGYKNMTNAAGEPFKNQGQCVSSVSGQGKNQ